MKDVRLFFLSMIAVIAFAAAGCSAQEAKKTEAAPAKTEAVKSDAATAEKAPPRQPEERLAPGVRDETLKAAYGTVYKECADKSLPIDHDEFLMALAGVPQGTPPLDIAKELGGYLACRSFADVGVSITDEKTYLTEPAFKRGVGNSGLSLSGEDKKKASGLLAGLVKKNVEDNFIFLLVKGERKYMGKPFAEGVCGSVEEKNRAGCIRSWNTIIQALDKKDSAVCETIAPADFPGAKDWCKLFVTRNAELCETKGFLKPIPEEVCADYAAIFSAIAGDIQDLSKIQLKNPASSPGAVLKALQIKDKCVDYSKEFLLPKYCDWRANVSRQAALDKIEKEDAAFKKSETEKIKEVLDAEAKQIEMNRLMEEEKAKEEEAKKKAEEEAAKSSSDKSSADTETKETKPETAPSKETTKPTGDKNQKPAAGKTAPTTKKTAGGK